MTKKSTLSKFEEEHPDLVRVKYLELQIHELTYELAHIKTQIKLAIDRLEGIDIYNDEGLNILRCLINED